MKKINKTIMAGTLAASFILGLGYVGLTNTSAFAASSTSTSTTDSANSTSTPAQQHGGKHGHGGFGFHGAGADVMKEAAAILGVDQTAMMDSLKTGSKSLADLASEKGLSEDDFLTKLNAAVTSAIDAQVTAGTLTQDQATQLKSGLADRLKQQVENKGGFGRGGMHDGQGMMDGGRGGKGGGHGKDGFGGGFMNNEALAGILGMTQDEIRAELDAGKTLVEIAQAKGISEDDLIAKLKDGMTDHIKQFVESKHQKPAKAQASTDTTAPDTNASPAPAVTE